MRILGISAFYHDSAAALLVDGKIAAAAQEERFTRKKHDPGFPAAAVRYCLAEGNINADELDHVVFYEKPFLKFERLLETYLAFAPRGFQSFRKAIPVWLKEKLFQKSVLRRHLGEIDGSVDWDSKLLFADHHQSHAASAFFASPFSDSAILTLDGVGEWTTTSAGYGQGNALDISREINFPHSIGLLYSAFTYYTGFKVNSGEYKVMGLAPYGRPKYAGLILDRLVDLKDDGSFRLDLDYFDYCTGLTMTNSRFDDLFGGKPRPPPTGDAMDGGYLGPSFAQADVEQRLGETGAVFSTLDDDRLIQGTVDALVAEKAVGWFQGRMEFGPRALGARSILGDPRSPTMQSSLNLRVKFRESFRPFAPAVLREDVAGWFDLDGDSPYMQIVADVLAKHRKPANPGDEKLFGIERLNLARSEIPAVTHVDYSARIQTVHRDTNPRFHALLMAFKARTGCPVLVNTSFNVRGEPIVCTPEDAFRCFMGSDIEVLVIGNCFLNKEDQPSSLKLDYKNRFELD
ncbi:MAG TPA: carbamoyltransferase N-terminal domain-containing protein [Bradyrhizobium sp.]|nr:carbamoyltransferase N-terminal domain-containing protein [Bradyrhizobium sp.]